MNFVKRSTEGYREIVPSILMHPLAHGEKTNMIETNLAKGGVHQLHSRPYEQSGYLIPGKTRLTVESQRYDVEPGDSWCIPADVKHAMEILEDAVIVEIFSPVREEYL